MKLHTKIAFVLIGLTLATVAIASFLTSLQIKGFLDLHQATDLRVTLRTLPSRKAGCWINMQPLAAAISTGLACVGAGIAVASSGAAAVGAIAEKPESFGRSLIFVGLSEGIAIYGLLISFLVLPR